jgi:hypothetical protein
MNHDGSMLLPAGPKAEGSPLILLEDILCNRIIQKKAREALADYLGINYL